MMLGWAGWRFAAQSRSIGILTCIEDVGPSLWLPVRTVGPLGSCSIPKGWLRLLLCCQYCRFSKVWTALIHRRVVACSIRRENMLADMVATCEQVFLDRRPGVKLRDVDEVDASHRKRVEALATDCIASCMIGRLDRG